MMMRITYLLTLLSLSLISHAQEKLVNVNGINFNVYVKGLENRAENTPVIIFENGMGADLGNWNTVIDQISAFAPVFAYDRAGIGKSDKVYKMPDVKFVNENLQAILKSLKIPPPYVLVGHSFGGVYIRSYAGFYPDEVAGLVFIDPADFTETKNDWNNIFRTLGLPDKRIDEMLQRRLYQTSAIDSLHYGPWSEGQVLTELRRNDFTEISHLLLPDVPVYFFVGGKFEVPVERRSREYDHEQFFHVKNNSNIARWKKLIYASKKPGALIYLTNAGHYIHRDDPESVITNIKVLVEGLKAQNKDSSHNISDEVAIKKVIENFLTAVGNYDTDALSPMFTEKANISGASLKNGKWNSYTMTIQDFISALKSDANSESYKEPVNHWIIHVDGGQLAFVRADATLFIGGIARSHNIDYFTLIKENGGWKILNGSYVSTSLQE